MLNAETNWPNLTAENFSISKTSTPMKKLPPTKAIEPKSTPTSEQQIQGTEQPTENGTPKVNLGAWSNGYPASLRNPQTLKNTPEQTTVQKNLSSVSTPLQPVFDDSPRDLVIDEGSESEADRAMGKLTMGQGSPFEYIDTSYRLYANKEEVSTNTN